MNKATFTVNKEQLQVTMERIFDAPRELVFKTMTDPKLIPEWWGPSIYTTKVDKHEFKVGGVWRFIQRDKDGNEFAFNGVIKEIVPNEKVVQTFEFEPMAGHVLVETAVFEDVENGKTKVTTTSQFASQEDLEGMVGSGMEGGATESWERLAKLVEKVK
jgi:uncharacterized protein YndB with AHSA1/START domain